MNLLYRRVGRLPALLLILMGVAAGCTSTSYRVVFEMEANNTAKVMVTGFRPQVLVENQGPGQVTATFLGRSTEETATLTLATLRTFHEPTQVVLRTDSSGRATVLLQAFQATDFLIDQAPMPTVE